jgi:short subunit dehydrogenase-like uncharacterized protein
MTGSTPSTATSAGAGPGGAAPPTWMIYGANGFTGELVAREAVERGERPLLAGRRREPIEALARELSLPHRIFGLEEPGAVQEALWDVKAVLHCAGPFVLTARPIVEACLGTSTHYLDITGEIPVFETVLARDAQARAAGVALLPGVGFDVVPSDNLAARLAEALPDATHLDLAFVGEGAEWSRGTLKTVIENLPATGAVRREGKIVPVPLAYVTREIDFPDMGRRTTVTIPWGDVSTAYHTTGILNVRVFTGMPPKTVRRLRWLRPLVPVLGLGPVKKALQKLVERTVTGPDRTTRANARIHLWGEARNTAGRCVTATLVTPEGYSFTARSSVECVRRVLAGTVEPGAWTPSKAFGNHFVDGLPHVIAGEIQRR